LKKKWDPKKKQNLKNRGPRKGWGLLHAFMQTKNPKLPFPPQKNEKKMWNLLFFPAFFFIFVGGFCEKRKEREKEETKKKKKRKEK
jgi:hypothetical protein